MRATDDWPKYDPALSYLTNYAQAPDFVPAVEVMRVPGTWSFCGLAVDSPLGIPAGPLLNGRWVLYYTGLGFDVLTYKTVRSSARECYPLPNLVPVDVSGSLRGDEFAVRVGDLSSGSWAVSFGMPSMEPDVWRRDIEWTKSRLPGGKLLCVSVVGTIQPDWTIDDLADDYARCARWAVESGADCVETNFSCPNVSTCDGQLYQRPTAAALVAERVREAIGTVPLVVKIGHVSKEEEARQLISGVGPFVQGLSMTNSIATRVVDRHDSMLFEGQLRGICGRATREASVAQTRMFAEECRTSKITLELIGVGGAETADDVRAYLQAGATAVHIATAAMRDPAVALDIRRDLAGSPTL